MLYRSENLCPGPDIDVTGNLWNASSVTGSNGHLLKDQTVHADPCIGMNDDSIGVRNQQSAAKLTIQGNVSACHDAPKPMAQCDALCERRSLSALSWHANADSALLPPTTFGSGPKSGEESRATSLEFRR